MDSDLPKVLQTLQGKPLILHVIDSLQKAQISENIVVVGYKGEKVIDSVGTRARFAWQHQQLGTGHAVMQTEDLLKNFKGFVIVACGDVPMIMPETFQSLIRESCAENVKAVVLTMEVDNPTGYGRILKNDDGEFLRIIEEKDATPEQRLIKEVNSGTYIFDSEFLYSGLNRIDCNNAQNEYYLPDALGYILDSGYQVETLVLEDPLEGSGINTKQDLLDLEKKLQEISQDR